MNIVRVRRVGNSNVVSIPKELEAVGYTPGTDVLVEEVADGSLRLVRTDAVRALIRKAARRTVAEDREALAILEAHDRVDHRPARRR
jgi:antitoxin component of MazEF toxin-antitoxin module